jgi:hypothetical protein
MSIGDSSAGGRLPLLLIVESNEYFNNVSSFTVVNTTERSSMRNELFELLLLVVVM